MKPWMFILICDVLSILPSQTQGRSGPRIGTLARKSPLTDDDSYPDTQATSLWKRWRNPGPPPCSDADWTKYSDKGRLLLRLMSADDATAGAFLNPPRQFASSNFVDFPAEFVKWGYKQETEPSCDMSDDRYGMEDAFNSMGISTGQGSWKCYSVVHGEKLGRQPLDDQTYKADGKILRATGAYYKLPINVEDGAMMLAQLYSPATEAEFRNPKVEVDDLPDLQFTSDIAFGQWTLAAGTKTNQLRYVIPYSVRNKDTPGVVRRALQSLRKDGLETWPGVSFGMNTEAAQALLGTPIGSGVAFLLAQHKRQLGRKTITKIDVFGHTSKLLAYDPVMVFHVGDA